MKNLGLLITIFIFQFACAQNPMEGKWDISRSGYLGLENVSEYVLLKDEGSPFGDKLIITPNGRFSNDGMPPACGYDCVRHNTGTWKMAGSNHIRFTLTGQEKNSLCSDAPAIPMELGLYAVVKQGDTLVKLIKSDGRAATDLKMKRYSATVNAVAADVDDRYLKAEDPWEWMPVTATVPEQAMEAMLKAIPGFTRKAELLYVIVDQSLLLYTMLFEHNGQQYTMLYDGLGQKAALYGPVE